MKRNVTSIITLVLFTLVISACGRLAVNTNNQHNRKHVAKTMATAARKAGVSIDTARLAILSRYNVYLVAAPIREMQEVSATALSKGLDAMFVYYEGPQKVDTADLKPGYYTINIKANATGLGMIKGIAKFVDTSGRVIKKVEARVNIKSYLKEPSKNSDLRTDIYVGVWDDGPWFGEEGHQETRLPGPDHSYWSIRWVKWWITIEIWLQMKLTWN